MRTIVGSTRQYAEKTARIGREAGAVGLVALACRKLASPVAAWGGITFFERRLDGWTAPATGSSPGFHALQMSAADVGALREGGDPTQNGWSPASSSSSGVEHCDGLRPGCRNFSITTCARSSAPSKREAYAARFATFRRATGTTSSEPAVRIC
jgi:hypothetical protein